LLIAWNINHIGRMNGGRRLPTVAVGGVWSQLRDLLITATGANREDLYQAADIDEALTWLQSQPELN
jgi:hypothetical protein